MSVESLKRVLTKIKGEARAMRKEKYSKRLAPKAAEPKKTEAGDVRKALEDLAKV